MKKLLPILTIIVLCTALFLFYFTPQPIVIADADSPYQCTSSNKDKKKVLIFSSHGGGGHISAMNAITEYLQDDFCIGHSFIFTDVLGQLDPLQWGLSGKVSGEDWYNFLIKRKWHQTINLTYNFGSWYYNFRQRSAIPILQDYITKYRPDLIISVIPLVNNLLLKVAKKMDIPLLVIPTDLDATMALNKIYKPNYDKFYLGISYDDRAIRDTFKHALIDEKYIHIVGFPVKKGFFEPASKRAIKHEFGIPEDKPVIMLLMGAQGSQELYLYAQQLAKLPIPAHIIIALGKSEYLRKNLQHIHFPTHITTTILGFTDRMADLMKTSDLLISKSGSVSVNEAIYAQLPILLDGTSSILKWEQFNHNYIVKNGFGDIVKRYYQIPGLVTKILTNKELYDTMRKNLSAFSKPNPEQEIKLLVKTILADQLLSHRSP